MKNVFLLSMLFLLCTNRLYAQTDSLKVSEEKTGWQKTEKVLGIAVPSAMITYGIISLGDNGIRQLDHDVRVADKNIWNTHADDFLQFSPAVAAFGMKLCGVESTHNLKDMVILYALSNVLNGGIVFVTKHITGRERPDGSDNQSFPSGHTSTAFVAAEFLHQEYKDKSVWISVGGYTMASFIGVARIYNNKHWLSDVITGAGVGILSTKAIYWAYPYMQKILCPGNADGKSKKTTQALLFPSYDQQGLSLNFSYSF
ncbi:MAG: phosphatase PAP2 family protein [Candidatus Azobacteroides sp.]|nr:phosphatase PAP2 family protein [Candidatus Azobacteroides sp.]